jgi:hypothetical protein
LQNDQTPVIIELGMESQYFYLGLVILASFLFFVWFFVGRKGGYGRPTPLDLKKGENSAQRGSPGREVADPIVQADSFKMSQKSMRDVTPPKEGLNSPFQGAPLSPPPRCLFIYNGHDWDAYAVLGVSPYASFSEITRIYQAEIQKADPGKHEFLQTAYMAILKKF